MNLEDLKKNKVGILGFGIEGQDCARYFLRHGVQFCVFDANPNLISELPAEFAGLDRGIFITGDDYLKRLHDLRILFRSPGIKVNEPELQKAKKNGAIVTSQMRYFLENCPVKTIGITGTKGKGTTSKLIYEIFQKEGIKCKIAGNFGFGAIGLLDQIASDEYVILELSSFQLQDMQMSPHIAVVLMVTSDHLDYHASVEEYVQAKSSITRYQSEQDFAVVNCDYPSSVQIGRLGKAKKLYVQTLAKEQAFANGLDPFQIFNPEKFLQIKDGVFAEEVNGNIYLVQDGILKNYLNSQDLTLKGFYMAQNVAAAINVARIVGIKDEVIIEAARTFKGLEHRLEFVQEKEGIKFYNDSIGTTPDSCLAAIRSFTENEIVILGGHDKKADYQKLVADIVRQKNVKAVVLMGQIASELERHFKEAGYTGAVLTGNAGMPEAFAKIKTVAARGDVVLLAPATSSFGMFKDYKERGNAFKEEAAKW